MEHQDKPEPSPDLTPSPRSAGSDQTPAPPEETPRDWLARNGPFFLCGLALLAILIYKYGLHGVLEGFLTFGLLALGLSLVIFIHELGHFLVAKWCDVHVETFSIGFGPPIPGCWFQKGETTYMVAMIPLGGYVKMVGEGAENDEEADNPRSFKNKSVPRRMAIISAGVFMNMVMGCICFIFVYMAHGVPRSPGVIGKVDAASPTWVKGAQSGMVMYQIGKVTDPHFNDLRSQVVLNEKGQSIPFVFGFPDKTPIKTEIQPRWDDEGNRQIIGVSPPESLQLLPKAFKKKELAEIDNQIQKLKEQAKEASAEAQKNYAQQLEELGKKREVFQQKFRDAPVFRDSAAAKAQPPFEYGDVIIGTSTPDKPNEVVPLPADPRVPAVHPPPEYPQLDYFEYRRRLKLLQGQPIIVRVRRGEDAEKKEVDIRVPPAYHYDFGLRMHMDKISAVREGFKGVKSNGTKLSGEDLIGGRITEVELVEGDGKKTRYTGIRKDKPEEGVAERDLDPMRLPFQLEQWRARNPEAKKVKLYIYDKDNTNIQVEVDWDDSFRFDEEVPMNVMSPVALPALGIAYKVDNTIKGVAAGSPAAQEGLQPDDVIKAVCFYDLDENGEPKVATKRKWIISSTKGWQELKPNQWAEIFYRFQAQSNIKQLDLKVERGKEVLEKHLAASPADGTAGGRIWPWEASPDPWPSVSRGERVMPEVHLHKAKDLGEAVQLGMQESLSFAALIFKGLKAMIQGDVSLQVEGPIGIFNLAKQAADDNIFSFVLFLGIISVNLAVVNFLPIPVLDGGHMVFLLYEGVRGKPMPETIRIGATYAGLLVIGLLMLTVIFMDLWKLM